MKVGDLVIYVGEDAEASPVYGPGIVMDFDKDNDPIVRFIGDRDLTRNLGSPYYIEDVRVINESR